MTEPISVTALNQYIKGLLDRDRLLSQVLVRSEISNYKVYPSGHHYFSLKDAESSIRCVMFRREAGTPAVSPGKRNESGGDRPGVPLSSGRSLPTLLQPDGTGWSRGTGVCLRAAEKPAVPGRFI